MHNLGAGPRAGLERAHAEQAEARRRRRVSSEARVRAGCRRDRRRGSAWRRDRSSGTPSDARHTQCTVAAIREIEPWDACCSRARGRAARPRRRARRPGPHGSSAIPAVSSTGEWSRRSPTAGIDELYEHQAQALHERLRRPDDRHHRDGLGQIAVLSAADARGAHLGSGRARPVPVSRPRRSPRIRRARCTRFGLTKGDPSGDLRRRHPARRALGDPQAQQPDPHQPRHAPRRDPAPPPGLGRPVRQPRLRRDRRGPRVSRRVRLARRQRAAAAAPRGGDPRHRAALPARQRDDRQPGRAGRAADRP